jgi:ATP-dependent Clp protease protease subunit
MTKEERLNDQGVHLIYGDIDARTVRAATEFILINNIEQIDNLSNLTLIINSAGGFLTDAFALIDVMNSSLIPIHTVGLGEICSSGLFIFMNGCAGNRIITPNTSILSHQYSSGGEGKEHELISVMSEFKNVSERIINHYVACTGLSKKVIKKELLGPTDRWLSAEDAMKYGLCDKVKDFTLPSTRKDKKLKK